MREPEDSNAIREAQPRVSRWRKVSALAIGIIAALLTLGLYNFGSPSSGNAGQVLAGVTFPGLLGAMAIAGNAHAFSLWLAAAFNGILYGVIIWAALNLFTALSRKFL